MTTDMSTCRKHFPVLSSFMTYHQLCNQINATGVTSGAGNAYHSGAPQFTPDFQRGSCYWIFSFMCIFFRSLFVFLYFLFWLLCCLFFCDLRIMITPLISSNSSASCTFKVIRKTNQYLKEYLNQDMFCFNYLPVHINRLKYGRFRIPDMDEIDKISCHHMMSRHRFILPGYKGAGINIFNSS